MTNEDNDMQWILYNDVTINATAGNHDNSSLNDDNAAIVDKDN